MAANGEANDRPGVAATSTRSMLNSSARLLRPSRVIIAWRIQPGRTSSECRANARQSQARDQPEVSDGLCLQHPGAETLGRVDRLSFASGDPYSHSYSYSYSYSYTPTPALLLRLLLLLLDSYS